MLGMTKNMLYNQVLEQLGLAPSEIQVYVALLELDSAVVTDIARKSGINRTSCYDVLDNLVEKGLVSKFKKKKKIHFTAGDPRHLISYLDREKEEAHKAIENKKKLVHEVLPELMSKINPRSTKPKVSFYEGEKGMREAYEDTLTSKSEILAFANVATMHEGLPKFFPEYYKRRSEAQIDIKAIMPDNAASRDRASKDAQERRQSIILPDKSHTFTPEVNIYNDKMLVASWKEKMAVIIESKELADLMRLNYTLLWKALKNK